MRNTGKRTLAMLLFIMICVSLLPVPALAEEGTIEASQEGAISLAQEEIEEKGDIVEISEEAETFLASSGTCGDNLTWTLDDDGTLTISGTGAMTDYLNWDLSPWYNSYELKKVVIEQGVTSIGEYAFNRCTGLKEITIPESVTSIGKEAFNECWNLTSVTIPEGVMSIGDSAFSGCGGITSITIPEGMTNIGKLAFCSCYSLTVVMIPKSVTSIGERAFQACEALQTILVDERNTKYMSQDGVLYDKSGETLIRCPERKTGNYAILPSTTSIGNDAFCGCSDLTDVTIPEGVTSIGDSAFNGCSGITSVTIPEGVTSIPNGLFYGCHNLESIIIPEGVTSIGEEVFFQCYRLANITIPESVTSIGYWAFYCCRSLTSMIIPGGVTYISDSAFEGCDRLVSVTIQEGITYIPAKCFLYCDRLEEVLLPKSISWIGEKAFLDCSNLKNVYFNGTEKQMLALIDSGIEYSGNSTLLNAEWQFSAYGEYYLDRDQVLLPSGRNTSLKVTDENGMTVSADWSSSDPNVASVNSRGTVIAKKAGRAFIIATVDGTELTCVVRVLFKDVADPMQFYFEPIYNMVDKGVIGGYNDGTFRPTGNCNRAAVVTFLWKLEGRPEPEQMATFKDMTGNSDFDKAISWAAENNITTGYSDNTFRPWNTCNRASIVTFLWRYAGEPAPKKMATFKDMTGNADFDKAISWAAENGITTGYDGNLFKPWNTCNRLAVASFLDRYDKLAG